MRGPLDPKIDVVFRALFGSEKNSDLLMSLLNGILELPDQERIVSVRILTPLLEQEFVGEKPAILDLAVRDAQGRRYVVEMQCRNHMGFPQRMLYYGTRRYGEQLEAGDAYTRLEPLVLVVFTDFVLFGDLPGWRERFLLRGEKKGTVFSGHFSIVLVELPKYPKGVEEAKSLGEQWVAFLKEGGAMSERAEVWVTPELRKAQEELRRMAGDQNMRALYEARLRQVQTWATELEDSYLRGHQEGRQEGREEGRQEGREEGRQEGRQEQSLKIAHRLLQRGLPAESVGEITGLPLESIRDLQGRRGDE